MKIVKETALPRALSRLPFHVSRFCIADSRLPTLGGWGVKKEVGFYHSGMNETVPLDPHETKTLVNL